MTSENSIICTMNLRKHLVFLIIFAFSFVVDPSMASSHTTALELQSVPPQNFILLVDDSYLRQGVAGLSLESNLLASSSGTIMYTTAVRCNSSLSYSTSFYFSINFLISPENRSLGFPTSTEETQSYGIEFLNLPNVIASHGVVSHNYFTLHLGESYLCHGVAGLSLESNLLASSSGTITYTTAVRCWSNRTNFSASYSTRFYFSINFLNLLNVTDKTTIGSHVVVSRNYFTLLLGESYICHGVAGFSLESNSLASSFGTIMHTTPVPFCSNGTNSSASFSTRFYFPITFLISPENTTVGFSVGLGLAVLAIFLGYIMGLQKLAMKHEVSVHDDHINDVQEATIVAQVADDVASADHVVVNIFDEHEATTVSQVAADVASANDANDDHVVVDIFDEHEATIVAQVAADVASANDANDDHVVVDIFDEHASHSVPHKKFIGNRPSLCILIPSLDGYTFGQDAWSTSQETSSDMEISPGDGYDDMAAATEETLTSQDDTSFDEYDDDDDYEYYLPANNTFVDDLSVDNDDVVVGSLDDYEATIVAQMAADVASANDADYDHVVVGSLDEHEATIVAQVAADVASADDADYDHVVVGSLDEDASHSVPHKKFIGNRPSLCILIPSMDGYTFGQDAWSTSKETSPGGGAADDDDDVANAEAESGNKFMDEVFWRWKPSEYTENWQEIMKLFKESCYAPMVAQQQTQAAAPSRGRRRVVEVKSLLAARAAYRREQEQEQKRKLKKENFRILIEKAKKQNEEKKKKEKEKDEKLINTVKKKNGTRVVLKKWR